MKVIVYDPLYSNVGHYARYNRFLLKLIASLDRVEKVELLTHPGFFSDFGGISKKIEISTLPGSTQQFQMESLSTKGLNKLSLYRKQQSFYGRIMEYINASDVDMVYFTSQGLFPFQEAARMLRKKYALSVISIKPVYNRFGPKFITYYAFKNLLKQARVVFCTEFYYQSILHRLGFTNVEVLHERCWNDPGVVEETANQNNDRSGRLRLCTVGTISAIKSPMKFLKLLMHSPSMADIVSYEIVGKSLDKTGQVISSMLRGCKYISYVDDYINDMQYQQILSCSDFVVIPYEEVYTKYATSGVMWDAFEMKKPVLTWKFEPMKYYINKYGVGFFLDSTDIRGQMVYLLENRDKISESVTTNYRLLHSDFTFSKAFDRFDQGLRERVEPVK